MGHQLEVAMSYRIFVGLCTLLLGLGGMLPVHGTPPESAEVMSITPIVLQVNEDGFGDSLNGQTPSLEVFNGSLVAGTWHNGEPNAQIWRWDGGTSWTKVHDQYAHGTADMAVFGDYLYAGSWGDDGQIWRSDDLVEWETIINDGFDNPNNGIARFEVFQDELYVSTWNGTDGTEIWHTADGVEWYQSTDADVFDNPNNAGAIASEIYNGYLYWGVGNWIDGAELWRTTGIDEEWEVIFDGGNGDPINHAVASLTGYKGYLYASIFNENEIQVWRSSNGQTDWEIVLQGGMLNPETKWISGLAVYHTHLYLVVQNDTNGLEVWRTLNGTDWEMVGSPGFGDPNNGTTYWESSILVYEDALLFGTNNYVTGGEVWQIIQPLHILNLPVVVR